MRPVAPRLRDVEEVQLAADSDVYMPITVGVAATTAGHRCWVTRWRLSADDLVRLAAGEDVFVFVTADGFAPMQVHVGSPYHDPAAE